MKKKILFIIPFLITAIVIALCFMNTGEGGTVKAKRTQEIRYRYASKEEGVKLMLSNKEYYDGFSQNDLDYKMQKKDTTMEEYQAFAKEQVEDFTDEEKELLDGYFSRMNQILVDNGYYLPEMDEIVMIKTTMKEELGAGAYTHGTQIYFGSMIIEGALSDDKDTKERCNEYLRVVLWHELFHCLTRCNPDFREDMYKLIHFEVVADDYKLPPSVEEYHISNPDVEHHNSFATFHINGQDIKCFTDFVTTKHFENDGDSFFDYGTTALIPIDGTDTYYTPEQADNFNEVFGTNTGYVIDPEECMADNFSFAMAYGREGEDGKGYPNPEIIEGILDYVSK